MGRQPFHRSDFTGSAGPGLAKLRATVVLPDLGRAQRQGGSGLEAIRAAMRKGDWSAAILAAAKFSDLGEHAEAIKGGREALLRPEFQRQLKRDPAKMIEAAKAALLARWTLA